ncbi:hypothetical protein RT717_06760 [Imperialibacter roseus]|uniref:Uncharacterized protein n=1 Tax=Imperialibacter roseus TaxID=1324217 RepID=A0ABZ0IV04_9BACT|nr:hypothetical protein [Imperialibacter roseus]WOK08337.1 hypothetical protein RT717_06760 [Imperialibacter roseus]
MKDLATSSNYELNSADRTGQDQVPTVITSVYQDETYEGSEFIDDSIRMSDHLSVWN